MAKRILVIVNPHAGSAPEARELEHALDAAGIHCAIRCIPEGVNVSEWLDSLVRDFELLVAAGGDGTVSTVAARAVQSDKTLGVIPVGTLNHFARDAGIPTELREAVQVLAAGHTRRLDVGTVNGRTFLNNVSLGAYPDMVSQRERHHRRWPRPLATALAAFRTWRDLRLVTFHLCVDGDERIRRSPFLLVGNGEYEVTGMRLGRRPTLTDGRLAVYIASEGRRLEMLTLPVRALLGKLAVDRKFEMFQASHTSVELSRQRVRVGIDGEIHILHTPLRFSTRPRALRTIVPALETGKK